MTTYRIVIEGTSELPDDPALRASAGAVVESLRALGFVVTEAHLEQHPDTVDDLVTGERESAPLARPAPEPV